MNFKKLALFIIGLTVIYLITNANGKKKVPGEIQNADEDANIGPHAENHDEEQLSKVQEIKDTEPIDDDVTIVTIDDEENEPVEEIRNPKSIDDDVDGNRIIEHFEELARLARSATMSTDSENDMNRHRVNNEEVHRALDSMFNDEVVPEDTTEANKNKEDYTRMPKIVGGTEDFEKKIKYQVVLHNGTKAVCGASILSDRYLLSAAHCFIKDNDEPYGEQIYVLIGTIKLSKDHKDIPKAMTIYVPTMYQSKTDMNELGDIAIVKLTKGIGLGTNPNIAKVDLPKPLYGNVYDTYEGKQGVVSGFGANRLQFGPSETYMFEFVVTSASYPDELNRADVDVLKTSDCETPWYPLLMTPTRLCARMRIADKSHRGICMGDSGNALVHKNTAIGVTILGHDHCTEEYMHNGKPTIYTRVSYFMEFIQNAMADKTTPEMRVYHIINIEKE